MTRTFWAITYGNGESGRVCAPTQERAERLARKTWDIPTDMPVTVTFERTSDTRARPVKTAGTPAPLKIKGAPTLAQIEASVKAGNYMPEIAHFEHEAWQMKLSDLEQRRERARQHAREEPARWHGYQRAWFERIRRAEKARY